MLKPEKLVMTGDYILIKPEIEDESHSPIMLPESAQKKSTIGIVVNVGPGARNSEGKVNAPPFKEGNKVIYTEWAGKKIKWNKQEFIVMKEADIFAIIEEDK